MISLEMYDYLRALQDKFFKEPEYPELKQEMSRLYDELARDMDRDTRKNLLRMVDLSNELQCRITQAGFVAGFRLAHGIEKELGLDAPFSFYQEEERQALHASRSGK